jgi:hypothetical protein
MPSLELLQETNKKLNIYDDLSIDKNKNLIFVYCPPKVGSTTLITSIRISAFNKFTVLHIHNELMLKVLCNIDNVKVIDIIEHNKNLGKNVYVFDIYRSPIEQKISQYFEKLSIYHFNNSPQAINNYNVNKIIRRFNNLFPHLSKEDHYKDAYQIPMPKKFNFQQKYILQNINGVKYIKLRLKDSENWGQILTEILETKITIITDYETNNKPIREMFIKFKEAYKIPENLLNIIENCPSLKYYYSNEEREEYLNSWREKKTLSIIPFTSDEYNFYENISIDNQYIYDIQSKHYLDEGCSCKVCNLKRKNIIERIERGEKVNEKINHNENAVEYLKQKAKDKLKIIIANKTNIVNRQNENKRRVWF